jgi:spermidine synthase
LSEEQPDQPALARDSPVLGLLFVASGFSAVAYQVILSRYVQLIVGSTAYAISALLVAFMLGMSLGSALGGRLADRSRQPLRVYALAEAAIGAYCIAFPLIFPQLQALYLAIAPPIEGPVGPRTAVRFAIGVVAFVLPSVFMGITTPAFTKALAAGRPDMGQRLAHLYALNVFGAAAGALFTAYLLVPRLGLVGSIALASAMNFAVALLALRAARDLPAPAERQPTGAPEGTAGAGSGRLAILLAAALLSGLLSFGLEIVWTHLLAILLGNSVYAFGLMLGALLLGLAGGARLSQNLAGSEERSLTWIGLAQVLAGLFVVLTLGVWDEVPRVFLLFARSSPTFALLEAVRFAVAFALMLLPTTLIGTSFPLVLRCAGTRTSTFGRQVGLVYAVNTLGAVAGAIGGSALLLPGMGSLGSLRFLGVLLMLGGAGLVALLSPARSRLLWAAASAGLAVGGWLLPVQWDFNSLSLASSIYLGRSATEGGEMVFRREDATGGLTTVVRNRDVLTLLTNGKFQGDDNEEVPIQHRLANIPTLFTPGRERALVVGLGTGVTLASLAAHGFEKVVCAEISAPIVSAADRHFSHVNGGVLHWPDVELIQDDGRSVLLERPDRYDVVSVEVTTIWFAGVGSIYSEEFYRLVSSRLKRNGVLLQWFPMHHLSARNLYLVVNTMRRVFPFVSVWNHRHQGFVVASREPLALDLASIRADLAREQLRPYLRELASGSPLELLDDLVITDRDSDGFLDAMADLLLASRDLRSTDTWPVLEYETPKDILSNFSYFQNRATLQRFRSHQPFPFRGEPSPAERVLAEAAFARSWADPRALPRIAQLWAGEPEASAAAGRWVMDELTGEDAEGSGADSDALRDLATSLPHVSALLAGGAASVECRTPPSVVTEQSIVPLAVVAVSGLSLEETQPRAVTDRKVSAEWGQGWLVRPAGQPPRLDLALPGPRRLGALHLAVRPIDGDVVRARVFGRDASGRWHPLAGGDRRTETRCREERLYRLLDGPPLDTLRVELQGHSLSSRISVQEIWAEAADGR